MSNLIFTYIQEETTLLVKRKSSVKLEEKVIASEETTLGCSLLSDDEYFNALA